MGGGFTTSFPCHSKTYENVGPVARYREGGRQTNREHTSSRADPRAAMTYMFFPADAAVVNLRRKEAIFLQGGIQGEARLV